MNMSSANERVLYNDRTEIVTGPTNCEPAPMPSASGSVKQKPDDGADVDMQERSFHRGIVGGLRYLSIAL